MARPDSIRTSNRHCPWWLALIIAVAIVLTCGHFAMNLLVFGRLTQPTLADFEETAISGTPLVKAALDYRNDHGLLPQTWSDLVPDYLAEPPDQNWRIYHHCLGHREARGMTYFDFVERVGWHVRSKVISQPLAVPPPEPSRPSLTGEALFRAKLQEYERGIERRNEDRARLEDKLNFLGREKRADLLLEECDRLAAEYPDWWLPRMMMAWVSPGDPRRSRFAAWVQAHPSFANHWYLSLVFRHHGDTASALDELEKAAGCELLHDPPDSRFVGWGMAYDAARFSHQNRRHRLTMRLCQAWERAFGHSYGEQSWWAFRAATELELGDFAAAAADAKRAIAANQRQAMWADNLPELLAAAERHDAGFLYQPGSAGGEWEMFPEPTP